MSARIDRRRLLAGLLAGVVLTAPRKSLAQPQKLGVTLFGASWCPFCHKAAQLLVSLQQAGQIDLIVISLDHGPIGVVADPLPDVGQAEALGVRGVPVTVIFDPDTAKPSHVIQGFRGYRPFLDELRAAASQLKKGLYHG